MKAITYSAMVTLVAIVSIVLMYGYVLPHWFGGYKTYVVLIAGSAIAAVTSGWITYKDYPSRSKIMRCVLSLVSASISIFIVFSTSLGLLLNLRGS